MNRNALVNYYRKASFVLKIIRYLLTLIFIFFLISCTLIFRKDITVENIQLLAKYVSLGGGSSRHYEESIPINASDGADIFMLRDNIAVADKTGISLYDLSGDKLFNYRFSYSKHATVNDSHNILVYDIKGNEISIFNSFSRVFSQKYPYSVRCADINEKGFAVITGEKGYRSALIVYNDNFKEQFRWLSEDNYLTSISLSPDGKKVAVATAKSEDGIYKCGIRIFDIKEEEPCAVSGYFDELPIYISYSSDGENLYAVTDSGIIFCNSELKKTNYRKFNQSKIDSYHICDDVIVLCEVNNLSESSMTVTAFDNLGEKKFEFNVNDKVCDTVVKNDFAFVLGNDCVYKYKIHDNGTCTLVAYATISKPFGTVLCDSEGNCYIAGKSEIVRVDFTEKEEI